MSCVLSRVVSGEPLRWGEWRYAGVMAGWERALGLGWLGRLGGKRERNALACWLHGAVKVEGKDGQGREEEEDWRGYRYVKIYIQISQTINTIH